jgi:hypothetical protein
MRTSAALAAVAIALAVPAAGAAGDDEEEDESATRVSCAGGSAVLRLSGEEDDDDDDDDDGGRIDVELRVDVRRPVLVWRIVLVHERRLVYRGTRRWSRPRHSLRLARWVPDWAGRQTVTARLTTGAGRTCRLEATI